MRSVRHSQLPVWEDVKVDYCNLVWRWTALGVAPHQAIGKPASELLAGSRLPLIERCALIRPGETDLPKRGNSAAWAALLLVGGEDIGLPGRKCSALERLLCAQAQWLLRDGRVQMHWPRAESDDSWLVASPLGSRVPLGAMGTRLFEFVNVFGQLILQHLVLTRGHIYSPSAEGEVAGAVVVPTRHRGDACDAPGAHLPCLMLRVPPLTQCALCTCRSPGVPAPAARSPAVPPPAAPPPAACSPASTRAGESARWVAVGFTAPGAGRL